MRAFAEAPRIAHARPEGVIPRLFSGLWRAIEAGFYVEKSHGWDDGLEARIADEKVERALRQAMKDQNFWQRREQENLGQYAFPPSYFDQSARG
jgi:hypothetical protein